MSLAWLALESAAAKRDAEGSKSAIRRTATRKEPFIASSPPPPRLPALDPDKLAGLIGLRYAAWAAPLCAGRLHGFYLFVGLTPALAGARIARLDITRMRALRPEDRTIRGSRLRVRQPYAGRTPEMSAILVGLEPRGVDAVGGKLLVAVLGVASHP